MKQPPNCHACGKPLDCISEEYEGTQHWDWNEQKGNYDVDLPAARTEEVTNHCGHFGEPLNEQENEWFAERKS